MNRWKQDETGDITNLVFPRRLRRSGRGRDLAPLLSSGRSQHSERSLNEAVKFGFPGRTQWLQTLHITLRHAHSLDSILGNEDLPIGS